VYLIIKVVISTMKKRMIKIIRVELYHRVGFLLFSSPPLVKEII